jgi:para-nitrobenzyl esterase
MSEDCLCLNVWTDGTDAIGKRPVLVWCHGGGFEYGSGGAAWYDGANLAIRENVVVVTLNHRLNALGFLFLGESGDPRLTDAGNVGLLDIVAALAWVRDNIASFGGDPANVTLFGSSGGGCKISALLSMPAAQGLFHKAIVQSGVIRQYQPIAGTRTEKSRIAEQIVAQLGLRWGDIGALQQVPVSQLQRALKQVQVALGDYFGMRCCSAVVDGGSLPAYPFDPIAPAVSAKVPLLIGTTADESRILLGQAAFEWDAAAACARGQDMLRIDRAAAQQLLSLYAEWDGESAPSANCFAIATDHHFRVDAMLQAERKAQQQAAPVFTYRFDWRATSFGGKYRASHGVELPFVFANLNRAAGIGAVSAEDAILAQQVSRAWVAFARHGNPSHASIPTWHPFDPLQRLTMTINHRWQAVSAPGFEKLDAVRAATAA